MAADPSMWVSQRPSYYLESPCVFGLKEYTGSCAKGGGGWEGVYDKQEWELRKSPGCAGEAPAVQIKGTLPKRS